MARCFLRVTAKAPSAWTALRISYAAAGLVQRLAEPDRDAARAQFWRFSEKFAAAETEDTPPKFIEIDRNHLGGRPFEDLQDAWLERLQLPAGADAAFGEDADDLAVVQGVASRVDRPSVVPWAIPGSESLP